METNRAHYRAARAEARKLLPEPVNVEIPTAIVVAGSTFAIAAAIVSEVFEGTNCAL